MLVKPCKYGDIFTISTGARFLPSTGLLSGFLGTMGDDGFLLD